MTDTPQRYASWTSGKLPLPELVEIKRRGEKIVMVTAYDAPSGRLADAAGVDLILVGDSSGMVMHGRESTVAVTLDEIVLMTQWVTRGAKRPLVVADMPFGSYEASDEQAVHNAIRLVKEGGADAVKLERGGTSIDRARAIAAAGIPVMGHVGLTPQTATVLGGFKAQGRTADQAQRLVDEALALEAAGCFAIVYPFLPNPAWLIGLGVFEGIFTVTGAPARLAMLSRRVHPSQMGRAQGLYGSAQVAAAAIAAMAAGSLFGVGIALPFIATAIAMWVAAALLVPLWRGVDGHPLATRPPVVAPGLPGDP